MNSLTKRLHHEITHGNLRIVKLLLEEGADVKEVDDDGRTALHIAVQEGNLKIVEELLRAENVDVNAFDKSGYTPLQVAAEKGDKEIVKLLLANKDVDVNAYKIDCWPALHLATLSGQKEVVKLLLTDPRTNVQGNYWWTPLHLAAKQGNTEVVKLLTANEYIYAKQFNWTIPVHVADSNGKVNVVSELSSYKKLNINAADYNGCTPLHFAVGLGHSDIVKLLSSHKKIDINAVDNDGMSALHYAAVMGHAEVINTLLDNGGMIENKTNDGSTALDLAAENNNNEVTELLLKRGAKVNVNNFVNWTPLHIAAGKDYCNSIELLLKNGADVDVVNNEWWTPLHFATSEGNIGAINVLLSRGAKVDAVGNKGWTPLHFTAHYGHYEAAKILLAANDKNINTRLYDGRTPLHIAIQNKHEDLASLLLSNDKIDVNAKSKEGKTPIEYAVDNESEALVKALLKDHRTTAESYSEALLSAIQSKKNKIVKLFLNSNLYLEGEENTFPQKIYDLSKHNLLDVYMLLLFALKDANPTKNISIKFNIDQTKIFIKTWDSIKTWMEHNINNFNVNLIVNCESNYFSDNAVIDFAKYLKETQIPKSIKLNLSVVYAGMKGLQAICDIIKEHAPQNMTLTIGFKVDDRIIKLIADALKNSSRSAENLTISFLDTHNISKQGIRYLVEAIKSGNAPIGLHINFASVPSSLKLNGLFDLVDAVSSGSAPEGCVISFPNGSGLPNEIRLSNDLEPLFVAIRENNLQATQNYFDNFNEAPHYYNTRARKNHALYEGLLLACQNNNFAIAKYLVEHGAPLDVDDKESPLIVACKKGNFNIARLLFQYGAKPNAISFDGKNPLQIAKENHNDALAMFIENFKKPAFNNKKISAEHCIVVRVWSTNPDYNIFPPPGSFLSYLFGNQSTIHQISLEINNGEQKKYLSFRPNKQNINVCNTLKKDCETYNDDLLDTIIFYSLDTEKMINSAASVIEKHNAENSTDTYNENVIYSLLETSGIFNYLLNDNQKIAKNKVNATRLAELVKKAKNIEEILYPETKKSNIDVVHTQSQNDVNLKANSSSLDHNEVSDLSVENSNQDKCGAEVQSPLGSDKNKLNDDTIPDVNLNFEDKTSASIERSIVNINTNSDEIKPIKETSQSIEDTIGEQQLSSEIEQTKLILRMYQEMIHKLHSNTYDEDNLTAIEEVNNHNIEAGYLDICKNNWNKWHSNVLNKKKDDSDVTKELCEAELNELDRKELEAPIKLQLEILKKLAFIQFEETHEFYIVQDLPEQNDYIHYCNAYIFVNDTEKLYYLNEGHINEIKVNNVELLKRKINDLMHDATYKVIDAKDLHRLNAACADHIANDHQAEMTFDQVKATINEIKLRCNVSADTIIIPKMLCETGFLKEINESKQSANTQATKKYVFANTALQEYFAARYLIDCLAAPISKCELIKTDTELTDAHKINNNAFVRYSDKLYFVNNKENKIDQVPNITKEDLKYVDDMLKDNKNKTLTNDEFNKILAKTNYRPKSGFQKSVNFIRKNKYVKKHKNIISNLITLSVNSNAEIKNYLKDILFSIDIDDLIGIRAIYLAIEGLQHFYGLKDANNELLLSLTNTLYEWMDASLKVENNEVLKNLRIKISAHLQKHPLVAQLCFDTFKRKFKEFSGYSRCILLTDYMLPLMNVCPGETDFLIELIKDDQSLSSDIYVKILDCVCWKRVNNKNDLIEALFDRLKSEDKKQNREHVTKSLLALADLISPEDTLSMQKLSNLLSHDDFWINAYARFAIDYISQGHHQNSIIQSILNKITTTEVNTDDIQLALPMLIKLCQEGIDDVEVKTNIIDNYFSFIKTIVNKSGQVGNSDDWRHLLFNIIDIPEIKNRFCSLPGYETLNLDLSVNMTAIDCLINDFKNGDFSQKISSLVRISFIDQNDRNTFIRNLFNVLKSSPDYYSTILMLSDIFQLHAVELLDVYLENVDNNGTKIQNYPAILKLIAYRSLIEGDLISINSSELKINNNHRYPLPSNFINPFLKALSRCAQELNLPSQHYDSLIQATAGLPALWQSTDINFFKPYQLQQYGILPAITYNRAISQNKSLELKNDVIKFINNAKLQPAPYTVIKLPNEKAIKIIFNKHHHLYKSNSNEIFNQALESEVMNHDWDIVDLSDTDFNDNTSSMFRDWLCKANSPKILNITNAGLNKDHIDLLKTTLKYIENSRLELILFNEEVIKNDSGNKKNLSKWDEIKQRFRDCYANANSQVKDLKSKLTSSNTKSRAKKFNPVKTNPNQTFEISTGAYTAWSSKNRGILKIHFNRNHPIFINQYDMLITNESPLNKMMSGLINQTYILSNEGLYFIADLTQPVSENNLIVSDKNILSELRSKLKPFFSKNKLGTPFQLSTNDLKIIKQLANHTPNESEPIQKILSTALNNEFLDQQPCILDLSDNGLTDNEAILLASLLQSYNKLVILKLSNNRISNEGFNSLLDSLTTNPSVKYLFLDDNFISFNDNEWKPNFTKELCDKLEKDSGIMHLDVSTNYIPKGELGDIVDRGIPYYPDNQLKTYLMENDKDKNTFSYKSEINKNISTIAKSLKVHSKFKMPVHSILEGLNLTETPCIGPAATKETLLSKDNAQIAVLAFDQLPFNSLPVNIGGHAFLVIERINKESGQRELYYADLKYNTDTKKVAICINYITPTEFLRMTKGLKRVYGKKAKISQNDFTKLLSYLNESQNKEDFIKFNVIPNEYEFNCIKWVFEQLENIGFMHQNNYITTPHDLTKIPCGENIVKNIACVVTK